MSMTSNTGRLPCELTTLDDSTYVFTFTEASRRAIDQFFLYMDAIYAPMTPANRHINLILDVRGTGVIPLSYAFTRLRRWMPAFSIHPPAHLAIVHDGHAIISMFDAFISAARLGHVTARGFRSLDEAIAWARNWS